ncbi:hypothetical protein [Azohydromonas aeria]|uniref:hypothetical protein n=1 Tax=Azohydromonas aeria TaxID=2590212 RepID=UPI0012FA4E7C|nr:hypothetical protein [Azohydromonas aeria]
MRNAVIHVTAGSCLAALLLAGGGLRGGDEGGFAAEPRGGGRGLTLGAEVQHVDAAGRPARIVLTLRNEGVETATHIQPLVLPAAFRLLHDGCTGEPLPSAASCSYLLARAADAAPGAEMALQVRYDYADTLDRSAVAALRYEAGAAAATVAAAASQD